MFAYLFIIRMAFAQQDFARVGPYAGGGFAFGVENIGHGTVERRGGQVSVTADNSPGFDARGGYRLLPYVAVEGDLQFFAFDLNANRVGNVAFNTNFATLDTVTFMANAKGYPLTGRIQPYGLFGFGLLYAVLDPNNGRFDTEYDAAFALRAGGGVDVYVTPKLLINVECAYVWPSSDLHFGDSGQGPGIDLRAIPIVVGVQYRF